MPASSLMNLFKHGPLNWPASTQSVEGEKIFNSESLAQLGQPCGNSANCENLSASPVSTLNNRIGPPNISSPVTIVVFNTVYLHAIRALSKVLNKVLKRLKPPVAYLNAASAIVHPVFILLVCASLNHVAIAAIGSGFETPPAVAVNDPIPFGATARNGTPIFKGCIPYNFLLSAPTSYPAASKNRSTSRSVGWGISKYFPLSKLLSYETFSCGHNIGRFIVVSSGWSRLSPALSAPLLTPNQGGSSAIISA